MTGQYQTSFNTENSFQITLGQNIQSLLYLFVVQYLMLTSFLNLYKSEDNSQLQAKCTLTPKTPACHKPSMYVAILLFWTRVYNINMQFTSFIINSRHLFR